MVINNKNTNKKSLENFPWAKGLCQSQQPIEPTKKPRETGASAIKSHLCHHVLQLTVTVKHNTERASPCCY